MVLIGVVLVLLALVAGGVLIVGTARIGDTVDIDVLGTTVSFPPLVLLITGMVVISVFWLGWAVLRSGLRRVRRRRADAAEAARAAEARRVAEEQRLRNEIAARDAELAEERRLRSEAEQRSGGPGGVSAAESPAAPDDAGSGYPELLSTPPPPPSPPTARP
ncbi:MAG: hypothetical protein ACRCYX_14970 [Dermatophilaceae bacterium]